MTIASASLPSVPFDSQLLSEHTRTLASDEFEGRSPGSAGEAKTIAYVSGQFARFGAQPAGENGGWTQRVPLRKIELTRQPVMKIRSKLDSFELKNGDSAVFSSLSYEPEVSLQDAPLVFVGYGVTAPEIDWDDFKG